MKIIIAGAGHTLMHPDVTVPNYEKTAKNGVKVCTVWGTADKTMPYYQSKQLKEIFPDMHFYTFEDSGHIFLFDEGDRINKIIFEEMQGENS